LAAAVQVVYEAHGRADCAIREHHELVVQRRGQVRSFESCVEMVRRFVERSERDSGEASKVAWKKTPESF
jgi:Ethanolamine utilization protein EutJ (predicted chaperonin)